MPLGEGWLEMAARRAAGRSPGRQGTIEGDRACERCGYSLKGLRWPGHCPECGTPFGMGGHAEEDDTLPRPGLGVLSAMSMAAGLFTIGGGLLLAGLAMPAVFDVAAGLAPVQGSRAWWIVIFVMVVIGVPGGVLWLIGAALAGVSGARPGDEGMPAPANTFEARPAWPRYLLWASAPGYLLAIGGLTLAVWPGLDLNEVLEVPTRLALVLGAAGVWPASMIFNDVARRLDEPVIADKVMLAGSLLAGCAAGAALGTMPARYLGCVGSLISGMAWLGGWFVVPVGVYWVYNVAKLRGPLNWAKGVTAVMEAATSAKPPARAGRKDSRQG